jgi:hypothetical protein
VRCGVGSPRRGHRCCVDPIQHSGHRFKTPKPLAGRVDGGRAEFASVERLGIQPVHAAEQPRQPKQPSMAVGMFTRWAISRTTATIASSSRRSGHVLHIDGLKR